MIEILNSVAPFDADGSREVISDDSLFKLFKDSRHSDERNASTSAAAEETNTIQSGASLIHLAVQMESMTSDDDLLCLLQQVTRCIKELENSPDSH